MPEPPLQDLSAQAARASRPYRHAAGRQIGWGGEARTLRAPLVSRRRRAAQQLLSQLADQIVAAIRGHQITAGDQSALARTHDHVMGELDADVPSSVTR